MKTLATIEARMESTRLPGKTLAPVLGRPMLGLMIERLQRAKTVNEVVIATTDRPADDAIEELARKIGVGCYRGSSEDVLDRVLKTAQAFKADVIAETCGDCPLIDPGIVDQVISKYQQGYYDYVSIHLPRTFPIGMEVKVFPTRLLAEVAAITHDPADHEHVSLYIYNHPERYRLGNLEAPDEMRSNVRLTVDMQPDLELVRTIYERLYPDNPAFTLRDVIRLLNEHSDLAAVNKNVQQRMPSARS